jgi:hypothetical protein
MKLSQMVRGALLFAPLIVSTARAEEWLFRTGASPNSGILGHREGNIFRSCLGQTYDVTKLINVSFQAATQSCPGSFSLDSALDADSKSQNKEADEQRAAQAKAEAKQKAQALANEQQKINAMRKPD